MRKMDVDQILKNTAAATGIAKKDLHGFFAQGEQKTYAPEEWLFHESTPRRWAGVVLEGEVEIVFGLHGSSKHLAILGPGALISESALLDELPHSTGAMTRKGATIWQIPREKSEAFRQKSRICFTALSPV